MSRNITDNISWSTVKNYCLCCNFFFIVSAGGTGTSNLQPSVTALTSVDPEDVTVKHLRIIISSLVADHGKKCNKYWYICSFSAQNCV